MATFPSEGVLEQSHFTIEMCTKKYHVLVHVGSILKVYQRPLQVSEGTVRDLFAAMEYNEEGRAWEQEADLRDVIEYTRGSKKLVIPEGWRQLLPSTI